MFCVGIVIFTLSLLFPVSCQNTGTCSSTINRFMYFKLGLPVPTTNAYVSGYLPRPSNWSCNQGYFRYKDAHGLFVSYHSTGLDFAIGVSSSTDYSSKWGLYFWQKNNEQRAVIRICRWNSKADANFAPDTQTARECLINKQIPMVFKHLGNEIVGVSWSGTRVTVHSQKRVFSFFVEGADSWDYATLRCARGYACAHQVVYNPITAIVTTVADGIQSYSVCNNCTGFPEHVFAVLEGGEIPSNFDFTNWFYLTNTSTPLSGRFVSNQPLELLCLWPIPALIGTATDITFDRNGTSDVRCNGFQNNGTAQALRFALNFTSTASFAREGAITIKTVDNVYVFSCSNSSTYTAPYLLPIGYVAQPYYCFTTFFINMTAGTKATSFVGMLPPVVREFVVTRMGDVHLNGYRIFSVGEVRSVNFNISSTDHRDFWTVAFVNYVDVLVDIEATNIKQILYCNNPLNEVKCQQMKFVLEDGFYTYAPVSDVPLPRSIVRLPRYMTHTYVNFTVMVSFYHDDGKENTPAGSDFYECVTCSPRYYKLFFGTGMHDLYNPLLANRTAYCVPTPSFSTRLFTEAFTTNLDVRISIDAGECPFTLESINNYLSFGSICFSWTDNGGCALHISTQGPYGEKHVFAQLYVSFTEGDNIIGVPPNNVPPVGVNDMSIVHLDVCTQYTIYGITGRGVIVASNATYIAGLYYVAPSGDLLAYKNSTTGQIYSIYPCQLASQVAVISDAIVGIASASENMSLGFNNTVATDAFYYHSNAESVCQQPLLTYAGMGICQDGSITNRTVKSGPVASVSPIITGNLTIPVNFTFSVQAEYVQMMMKPVTVDCSVYVCNGNPRCLQLLTQYASACRTIEQALQLSARLESVEVNSMITVSEEALGIVNVIQHDPTYNLTNVLPASGGGRSFIEDLLFDKVVTSGLGTVDQDYKACAADKGNTIVESACMQYYKGIMVLPGVVDQSLMAQYTSSLVAGMAMGPFTAALAAPFGQAVQARINYLALQTDVLQRNQQILANSFNAAIGNVTAAFGKVGEALEYTSDAISTVAQALNKVQGVVNEQGSALSQLTKQLASNFQAISSSIDDIYNRLDKVEADQQVDRLITGRLAALNAFVAQQLTKYTEVRASRTLAQQKINECVKSQSKRYGFCGNGTHVFSLVNSAPDGIMLLHAVLLPTEYAQVNAYAGLCVDSTRGYVLRDVSLTLFYNGQYLVTPRDMFEPRTPQVSDFVEISGCQVSYINVTSDSLSTIIPDYIDVNKTLEDILSRLPNRTNPELNLDIFNATYLNLTAEIADLTNKSEILKKATEDIRELLTNINSTLVDLEWLNRVETYIKWPWWVWLIIVLVLILFTCLMLFCCCSTGCCGIFSCLASSCDIRGTKLQRYEAIDKVHVQ
uniref:Spike glycoprotein n=1 Tax=Bat Coronavirus MrGD17 TaxID=3018855 RepID=A0AA49EAR2_9NIDO|nr:spike glycoprotein [Bat Coronavirus MrGD17]